MCGSRLCRTLPSCIRARAQGACDTYRSILGGTFRQTPKALPIRGHIDTINRMMTGDYYIGRGSRQRSLKRSIFCDTRKVSSVGRERAIELFRISNDPDLLAQLLTLSGLRLVCHCAPSQACHGDIITQKFAELHPDAFDRSQSSATPDASTLDHLAALREEPPSDQGSSADEDALPAGSGWTGSGSPMMIGTGYTSRLYCDGQSLASPGRWPPAQRRCPSNPEWLLVASLFRSFVDTYGSPELLMRLALGRVDSSPFGTKEIEELRSDIISGLGKLGINIKTSAADSRDVLLDYRFLELLLAAVRDPDVSLGAFAEGLRVGPESDSRGSRPFTRLRNDGAFLNNLTPYYTWKRHKPENRPGDETTQQSRPCWPRSRMSSKITADGDRFSSSRTRKQGQDIQGSSLPHSGQTRRRNTGASSQHACFSRSNEWSMCQSSYSTPRPGVFSNCTGLQKSYERESEDWEALLRAYCRREGGSSTGSNRPLRLAPAWVPSNPRAFGLYQQSWYVRNLIGKLLLVQGGFGVGQDLSVSCGFQGKHVALVCCRRLPARRQWTRVSRCSCPFLRSV